METPKLKMFIPVANWTERAAAVEIEQSVKLVILAGCSRRRESHPEPAHTCEVHKSDSPTILAKATIGRAVVSVTCS